MLHVTTLLDHLNVSVIVVGLEMDSLVRVSKPKISSKIIIHTVVRIVGMGRMYQCIYAIQNVHVYELPAKSS